MVRKKEIFESYVNNRIQGHMMLAKMALTTGHGNVCAKARERMGHFLHFSIPCATSKWQNTRPLFIQSVPQPPSSEVLTLDPDFSIPFKMTYESSDR